MPTKMKTYGEFRWRRSFPEGKIILEFLGDISRSRKPKDDYFDIEWVTWFVCKDNPIYEKLIEFIRETNPNGHKPEFLKRAIELSL